MRFDRCLPIQSAVKLVTERSRTALLAWSVGCYCFSWFLLKFKFSRYSEAITVTARKVIAKKKRINKKALDWMIWVTDVLKEIFWMCAILIAENIRECPFIIWISFSWKKTELYIRNEFCFLTTLILTLCLEQKYHSLLRTTREYVRLRYVEKKLCEHKKE